MTDTPALFPDAEADRVEEAARLNAKAITDSSVTNAILHIEAHQQELTRLWASITPAQGCIISPDSHPAALILEQAAMDSARHGIAHHEAQVKHWEDTINRLETEGRDDEWRKP